MPCPGHSRSLPKRGASWHVSASDVPRTCPQACVPVTEAVHWKHTGAMQDSTGLKRQRAAQPFGSQAPHHRLAARRALLTLGGRACAGRRPARRQARPPEAPRASCRARASCALPAHPRPRRAGRAAGRTVAGPAWHRWAAPRPPRRLQADRAAQTAVRSLASVRGQESRTPGSCCYAHMGHVVMRS